VADFRLLTALATSLFGMAQSLNADRLSTALSIIPSTAYSGLDSSTDFNSSELNGGAPADTSSSVDYSGYERYQLESPFRILHPQTQKEAADRMGMGAWI
jgi:hypothetical protein